MDVFGDELARLEGAISEAEEYETIIHEIWKVTEPAINIYLVQLPTQARFNDFQHLSKRTANGIWTTPPENATACLIRRSVCNKR